MSARLALRDATRVAHDRLDALMGACDLASRDGYARFLLAQAGALVPCETALVAAGADRLVPGFAESARSQALLADLAALGLAVPSPETAPAYDDPATLAGGLYVVEGSRLGAALLVRQVAPSLPCAFLGAPRPPGSWKQIVATLERILHLGVDLDRAVGAAEATFDCFERSARKALA